MDTGILKANKNEVFIAAYGTLRKGYGNSRLVDLRPDSHLGTGKTVEKFTLTASGIPFVNKTPSTQITVDVWKIKKDELESVDRLEGHPGWYVREQILVQLENTIAECWLYFNPTMASDLIPSGDYTDYSKPRK